MKNIKKISLAFLLFTQSPLALANTSGKYYLLYSLGYITKVLISPIKITIGYCFKNHITKDHLISVGKNFKYFFSSFGISLYNKIDETKKLLEKGQLTMQEINENLAATTENISLSSNNLKKHGKILQEQKEAFSASSESRSFEIAAFGTLLKKNKQTQEESINTSFNQNMDYLTANEEKATRIQQDNIILHENVRDIAQKVKKISDHRGSSSVFLFYIANQFLTVQQKLDCFIKSYQLLFQKYSEVTKEKRALEEENSKLKKMLFQDISEK